MIGRKDVQYIYQLKVVSKSKDAALFDTSAYQTTKLYFATKKEARQYAKDHFHSDDIDTCDIGKVIAANNHGRWTIFVPQRVVDLTYNNRINGVLYSLDGIDCATVRTPGIIIYLKAEPMRFQISNGRGMFAGTHVETGFHLGHTRNIKDATHFLLSYMEDDIVFMNGVLMEPRKDEVTLIDYKSKCEDHHRHGYR